MVEKNTNFKMENTLIQNLSCEMLSKKAFRLRRKFHRGKNNEAFTLIELLIVIGIIAILAAAVIIAINPGQQFAQARDATRESHINAIKHAVLSYQVDNMGSLAALGITITPQEICQTGAADCTDLVDLSGLSDYISTMPVDPQGGVETNGTGYFIFQKDNNTILVAENYETRFVGSGISQTEYESLIPTLVAPTGTSTGETTADGTVDTNNSEGTLYFVVTTSSTSPSETQVKNGQNHNGTAAADSGNQAVTVTGTQTVDATGLTADTTYYFHFMQETEALQKSNVATSGSFTTDEAPFSCATAGQGEHTVDGNTIYCDGSDNMWTPTFDLPATGTNDAQYKWSDDCYEVVTGCNSSTDGEANTACILSNCNDGGSNAAEQCDNLTYAGYSDWYLPAVDTLSNLYAEGGSSPTYDSNAQSVAYWSSTESNGYQAWYIHFNDGSANDYGKNYAFWIRCVRR